MDRIERSKQKSAELFGNADVSALDTDPDFADILNHFIFGDVYYHGRLNHGISKNFERTKLRE